MAISWDISISNVNVQSGRAMVCFKRTDSDYPDYPETYTYYNAIIVSSQDRVDLLNDVWNKHLAAASRQTSIADFVTNMAVAGKANLEAREI